MFVTSIFLMPSISDIKNNKFGKKNSLLFLNIKPSSSQHRKAQGVLKFFCIQKGSFLHKSLKIPKHRLLEDYKTSFINLI